jgi:hypothetical protein
MRSLIKRETVLKDFLKEVFVSGVGGGEGVTWWGQAWGESCSKV